MQTQIRHRRTQRLIWVFYLFIHLFVCLFIYLFIYLFTDTPNISRSEYYKGDRFEMELYNREIHTGGYLSLVQLGPARQRYVASRNASWANRNFCSKYNDNENDNEKITPDSPKLEMDSSNWQD